MVANAQAQHQTYNVSTDWLASYATTGRDVLGKLRHLGTDGYPTRSPAGRCRIVEFQLDQRQLVHLRRSANYNILPTYYNASTGYLNSGTTQVGTYTYTVPFKAYQFNPGQTNAVAVGEALTQQIAHTTLHDIEQALTLPGQLDRFRREHQRCRRSCPTGRSRQRAHQLRKRARLHDHWLEHPRHFQQWPSK